MLGCAPKKAQTVMAHLPSPSGILEQISRKDLLNKNIKGLARITVQSPEGMYSTACAVILRFPDALRVETIPPIGPPNLFLAIHKESLKVYLPNKGAFYSGSSTKENISRFLPFPLDAREIIPVLMGMLPPDFQPSGASLNVEADDDLYRINVFSNGQRIRSVWVDPASGEMKRVDLLGPDERTIYSVKLEDYRRIDGISIPQNVEIRLGAVEGDSSLLRVRYSDLQLSIKEENALYDLEIPPGITPISLD